MTSSSASIKLFLLGLKDLLYHNGCNLDHSFVFMLVSSFLVIHEKEKSVGKIFLNVLESIGLTLSARLVAYTPRGIVQRSKSGSWANTSRSAMFVESPSSGAYSEPSLNLTIS